MRRPKSTLIRIKPKRERWTREERKCAKVVEQVLNYWLTKTPEGQQAERGMRTLAVDMFVYQSIFGTLEGFRPE